ncbi:hypothetical protein SAMN03159382_00555 [Pseudomonas sp. NFACC23-1]|uniref:nuclear transport factor 2 family protein n=1 Tax=unclassified Pseudomonas TaxID=196821 RepID=UPI000884C903|nr:MULTISPECIES: nuclear transport factor 2 family protein [unclassified Pseudomonas]SDB50856.1 hypothetical protein SAMN03159386_03851 [Pseudomonas sp. NFACC17-2]SEI92842.1 hypothetical protein SAMN03159382_00555 [Pseudomonas sp. NFACC23-1]SFW85161.1 hypothetical protein SAMN05660640_04349 [Pseudomonas sp. NFACC16-2]
MENSKDLYVVLLYLKHMEAGDTGAALRLASDDATFWMPGPGTLNKAQLEAFFEQVGPMIKSMVFTLHGITEQDGRLAVEATGEAQLSNGQIYTNEYHFLFIVKEGKIQLMKEYADTAPASVFF